MRIMAFIVLFSLIGCKTFSGYAYVTTLLECKEKSIKECDKKNEWEAIVTTLTPDKCADVLIEKMKIEKDKVFVCRIPNWKKFEIE